MSKSIDEMKKQSNENVCESSKHWIVIVNAVFKSVLISAIVIAVYMFAKKWINLFADSINDNYDAIPFEIKNYIWPVIIIILVIYSLKKIIGSVIEFKTVNLSVNNVQIKGVNGLFNSGSINASLDQVVYVKVSSSLLGKLLHYGTIEISLRGTKVRMEAMIDAEAFQEQIVLLQDAQKEQRSGEDEASKEDEPEEKSNE